MSEQRAEYVFPAGPLTWHEGPCFEDGNGAWWDVEFEDPLTIYFVHRESGQRLLMTHKTAR
jgi:hypothetical protein